MKTNTEKGVDDLSDGELEALDREIAKTPEGRALLRRVLLPDVPPMKAYQRSPLFWWGR